MADISKFNINGTIYDIKDSIARIMIEMLENEGYLKQTDVIDSLTSTSSTTPLSANQGKELNTNKIDNITIENNTLTFTANGTTKGTITLPSNGLTATQTNQLSSAYTHSQSTHAPSNAEENVQSDWNITNTTSDAYIKNKPTIPSKVSQLTNDSGFITSIPSEYVTETELTSKGYAFKTELHSHSNKSILDGITSNNITKWNNSVLYNSSIIENANTWLTNGYIKTGTTTINLPSILSSSERYGVLFFIAENSTAGTGTQIFYPSDGSYRGRMFTRNLTTMNTSPQIDEWKLLSVGNIPTKISELTNDSSFVTESYVTNKIAEAQLGGGSGEVNLDGLATKDDLNTKVDKVNGKGLSTNDLTNTLKSNYDTAYKHSQSTHFSGNYNDLTNKPTIPSLTGYATKDELNTKVDKIEGKRLSTNDLTNTLKSNYDTAYTHSQSSHNYLSLLGGTVTGKVTFNNNIYVDKVDDADTSVINKLYFDSQIKNIFPLNDDNVYISNSQIPEIGDCTGLFQEAIDRAVSEDKKIVVGKGIYRISGELTCPDNCIIEIEGNGDCFANSMQRYSDSLNNTTLWYENINHETLILYTGTGTLFNHPGGTGRGVIFKFKNLAFRNAPNESDNYLIKGRIVGQQTVQSSSKGKVYAENCLFSGFKVCFGDKYVTDVLEKKLNELDGRNIMTKPTTKLEKCCFVGSRCRFVACGCAVNLGVDARFIDCSFNNGWYGIVFQDNSGFSTISNCRIEWLKLYGIYSENSHDITIIGNEFDRIGWAGVYFTNNSNPNICNNIFRRCGSDTNYDYTARTKIIHIYVENCTQGMVNSNVTVKKDISDSGSGTIRPANAMCIRNNDYITVVGNDFTGCTTGTYNALTNNTNSLIGLNNGVE